RLVFWLQAATKALTVIGTVSGLVCSFSSREPSTRASTASSLRGIRVDMPGILSDRTENVPLLSFWRSGIVRGNHRLRDTEQGWTRFHEIQARQTPSPCSSRFTRSTVSE